MDEYFEIEIIDDHGNKHYEISSSLAESHMLCKMHNGVSFKTVK